MKKLTVEEFQKEIRAQGGRIEEALFRCPKCNLLQSMNDLIEAGAGKTTDDVRRFAALSCIGRFTKDKGCNLMLLPISPRLFQFHKLEVVDKDGLRQPRFEVATPEEAEKHREAARK